MGGVLQVIDTAIDWVDDTVEWLSFSDQTLSWQSVVDAITPNAAPTAVADMFIIDEDALLTGTGLLDNDSDPDGDVLSVSTVEGQAVAQGGTTVDLTSGARVTLYQDGSFAYDQRGAFDALDAGQKATDSFTYRASDGRAESSDATVTITITGLFDNSAPIATDDVAVVSEDGTVAGNVLANDSDPDGHALSVTALDGSTTALGQWATLASGAQVLLQSDGTFDYDPNGAFDGLDQGQTATDGFDYTVSDGQGGFDTARVALTVTGVSLLVTTQSVTIGFEGEATGPFAGAHGLVFDGLNVVARSDLSGARVGSSGSDGDFQITAGGEDFDLDGLRGIAASGRQKVTVQGFDDGVLVASTQVNLSARRASDISFDTSFDSVDAVSFTGGGTYFVDDIGLIVRTVVDPNVNLAPTPQADALTTTEAAGVSANLLANDSDPNGDPLTLVSVDGDSSGSVTLASGAQVTFAANGDVTYDPMGAFDALYDGQEATDSFVYQVADGRGGVASSSVVVTLSGIGPAPSPTTISFETAQQTGPDTVIEDEFVFDGGSLTSADPGVASGSLALAGAAITTTRSDAGTFDLDTLVVTVNGKGKQTVVFEGYLDGALIGTQNARLNAGREISVKLQDSVFDGVDAVTVSTSNGLILDDMVFLA